MIATPARPASTLAGAPAASQLHCFGCRRTTRDFLLWLHGVDPVFPGIVRYALAFGWSYVHA